MKFVCDNCQARYAVEDWVPEHPISIVCARCGYEVQVTPLPNPETLGDAGEHWYYAVNGATFGPFDEDDLVAKFLTGQLGDEALLWRRDYEGWQPADSIEAFGPALSEGRDANPQGATLILSRAELEARVQFLDREPSGVSIPAARLKRRKAGLDAATTTETPVTSGVEHDPDGTALRRVRALRERLLGVSSAEPPTPENVPNEQDDEGGVVDTAVERPAVRYSEDPSGSQTSLPPNEPTSAQAADSLAADSQRQPAEERNADRTAVERPTGRIERALGLPTSLGLGSVKTRGVREDTAVERPSGRGEKPASTTGSVGAPSDAPSDGHMTPEAPSAKRPGGKRAFDDTEESSPVGPVASVQMGLPKSGDLPGSALRPSGANTAALLGIEPMVDTEEASAADASSGGESARHRVEPSIPESSISSGESRAPNTTTRKSGSRPRPLGERGNPSGTAPPQPDTVKADLASLVAATREPATESPQDDTQSMLRTDTAVRHTPVILTQSTVPRADVVVGPPPATAEPQPLLAGVDPIDPGLAEMRLDLGRDFTSNDFESTAVADPAAMARLADGDEEAKAALRVEVESLLDAGAGAGPPIHRRDPDSNDDDGFDDDRDDDADHFEGAFFDFVHGTPHGERPVARRQSRAGLFVALFLVTGALAVLGLIINSVMNEEEAQVVHVLPSSQRVAQDAALNNQADAVALATLNLETTFQTAQVGIQSSAQAASWAQRQSAQSEDEAQRERHRHADSSGDDDDDDGQTERRHSDSSGDDEPDAFANSGTGPLDPEQLAIDMQQVRRAVDRCHTVQMGEGYDVVSSADLEIVVQPDGRAELSLDREIRETTFGRCMRTRDSGWRFSAFEGNAITIRRTYTLQ